MTRIRSERESYRRNLITRLHLNMIQKMRRRDFLPLIGCAPLYSQSNQRPQAKWGAQIGDVAPGRAMIWSRSDRPARMIVEWATTESFRDPKRVLGSHAIEATDFTARIDLRDLPPSQHIFYRVYFESLGGRKNSERTRGQPFPHRSGTSVATFDSSGPAIPPARDMGSIRNGEACGPMKRCAPSSRLLPSLGRHNLCRSAHPGPVDGG